MTDTLSTTVIPLSAQVRHLDAKARRDDLGQRGFCINGESHGPATHGCLCAWCRAVHKRGVQAVLADPNAPPRPPGYQYKVRDERPVAAVAVTPPL